MSNKKCSCGVRRCMCDEDKKKSCQVHIPGRIKLCAHERTEFKEACHCMIFAKCDYRIFDLFEVKYAILMQVRADGTLGFPGGFIEDYDQDVVVGLERELEEEMNFDIAKFHFSECNYIFSHFHYENNLYTHFYGMEVSFEDFQLIEKRVFDAQDYGYEVLGTVRVPLYIMTDGYHGFPAFLDNNFVNNAREQLLCALRRIAIMTDEEIEHALNARKVPPCQKKESNT